MNANHLGRITYGFPIDMLMPMEQILRLVFKKIIDQSIKPRISIIIPLMKTSWRIMGDENVNGREG